MIHKAVLYELDRDCPYVHVKSRKNMPMWFNRHLVGVARKQDILMNRFRKGGRKNQNLYALAVKKKLRMRKRIHFLIN